MAANTGTKKTKAASSIRKKKMASAKTYIRKLINKEEIEEEKPKKAATVKSRKTKAATAKRKITKSQVTKSKTKKSLTPEEMYQKTQEKAYDLYVEHGYQGDATSNWVEAESFVSGMVKQTTAIKASNKKALTPETFQQKVQEKAYELYANRGYTHGDDSFDWIEAEKLVREGK